MKIVVVACCFRVYPKNPSSFCFFRLWGLLFLSKSFIMLLNEQLKFKEHQMFETIPKELIYAYARVSTLSQKNNSSLNHQRQEFIKIGVPEENIRIEIGSGTSKLSARKILNDLIFQELTPGSVLVVTKLDRCARNTLEFLKLQEMLFQKQIIFVSLDLPQTQDIATNRLIATNLAAIASFETERRRERQLAGIKIAKEAGRYKGRKTVIDRKLVDTVRDLKETKRLSVTQISKITGRSRNTIYKVLREKLDYVPYHRLVKASSTLHDQNPD